ncbi:MAG: hypothetical protein IPH57_06570 [Saprospiraceae bacterium]|nr:hypothetical protein [Saprospiraceae bacterium]
MTRTYRITDCSNNYIDVVQTINVSDVTDPTASNPQILMYNVTVQYLLLMLQ